MKAEKAGLNASDYVRQAAKKAQVKAKRKLAPEEIQLINDLSGVANNLNQLTKEAHKQNLAMIAPELLKALKKVNNLLEKFDNDNKD